MSQKVNIRKFMRKEVRKNTSNLGQQMMKNTMALPLRKRLQIALIIIFKKPI